jgi:hypothetical protein
MAVVDVDTRAVADIYLLLVEETDHLLPWPCAKRYMWTECD